MATYSFWHHGGNPEEHHSLLVVFPAFFIGVISVVSGSYVYCRPLEPLGDQSAEDVSEQEALCFGARPNSGKKQLNYSHLLYINFDEYILTTWALISMGPVFGHTRNRCRGMSAAICGGGTTVAETLCVSPTCMFLKLRFSHLLHPTFAHLLCSVPAYFLIVWIFSCRLHTGVRGSF